MTYSEFMEALSILEQKGDGGKIKELHQAFFSQRVTYGILADLYDDADEVMTHKEGVDKMTRFIYNFQIYGSPENWNWDNWEAEKAKYYSVKVNE